MKKTTTKILMSSGMLAVIFYAIHVIYGGLLWKGYSHLHQPISDLTAIGAPDRVLMQTFTTTYGILALIFALTFTITEHKRHNKFLFLGGILFVMLHILSLSYGLFPENLPGQTVSLQGKMHIIITALIVPFTILTPLISGFGFIKETGWKTFGIYSMITGILITILGGLSAIFYMDKLPYFGLMERLNIGVLQLWTFFLSLKLTLEK
jgi:hypothetical membrane protein